MTIHDDDAPSATLTPETVPTAPELEAHSASGSISALDLPVAPSPSGLASQALEQLRGELLAMDPARVLPVNVDVPAAAMTVLGALEGVRALQPALAALCGAERTQPIERLELVARAALAAHARWSMAPTDDPVGVRVRTLTKMRDVLLAELRALIAHGVVPAGVINELVGGQRFDSLCLDVLQLVSVFQQRGLRISRTTAIDAAYLGRAENLADEVLVALAERRLPQPSEAADLRDRAFSLMVHTYDDVRRLISYLRWKEGDAAAIAPSLYAKRTRRGRRKKASDATP